jgi:hypothetical protein
MKTTVRNVIKVLPGKMEEGMELVTKWIAIANRVLGIPSRCYRPLSGGGDSTRTIIWEMDLDNLAAFETHPEKIGADPEMQALFPKLNAVIDSIDVEFYYPIPVS